MRSVVAVMVTLGLAWGAACLLPGCDRVPSKGEDSIFAAADRGDTGTIVSIMRKGYDVNTPDDQGMTALQHAAAANQPEVLEMLLNDYGANATLKDKEGKTALEIAVEKGNQEAASILSQEDR